MAAIPLTRLVAKAYANALAAGDLVFTSSAATTDILLNDVSYRLRFCPSLLRKPQSTPAIPKPNPFLPPHPGLLIPATIPGYNLVLNRFPIIPHHFLLCTSTFEPQSAPLRPEDVTAVYNILNSWDSPEERLYGFFNSGPHSGASQPHRHVQFFPLPKDRVLPCDRSPAGTVWTHPGFPFKSFCVRFVRGEAGEAVEAYETLLGKVEEVVGKWGSYNLGVTKEWIVVAPRVSEGRVGVNGTVLAGEVMVKMEEDWEFVRNGGLGEVLRGIGVVNETAGEGGRL
ncbi:hypothetical protein K440DRAFT_637588 [Wilcoxina mikolae CBS 423.85]|nr:hypothetical protein K440DRAFT_637588 [Wilcoxina mikolae CBS 423.85]